MQDAKMTCSLREVLSELHRDEKGAVSLETVLIIGAIALPILIFLIKVGWPMVKAFFTQWAGRNCSRVRRMAEL